MTLIALLFLHLPYMVLKKRKNWNFIIVCNASMHL